MSYSSQRVLIGSSREALRADKKPATKAANAKIAAVTKSIRGAFALTPYRRLAMKRVAAERCGKVRTFSFALERASNIMRRNQKQAVDGKVMPLGIPKKYLSCFM